MRVRQAAGWFVRALLVLTFALVMLRLSYSTSLGGVLFGWLPDSFWDGYFRAIGLAGSGNAESFDDAEAALIFALYLAAAIGGMVALRALRRSSS